MEGKEVREVKMGIKRERNRKKKFSVAGAN